MDGQATFRSKFRVVVWLCLFVAVFAVSCMHYKLYSTVPEETSSRLGNLSVFFEQASYKEKVRPDMAVDQNGKLWCLEVGFAPQDGMPEDYELDVEKITMNLGASFGSRTFPDPPQLTDITRTSIYVFAGPVSLPRDFHDTLKVAFSVRITNTQTGDSEVLEDQRVTCEPYTRTEPYWGF